jgi:ATP-dependent Lon protease
LIPKKNEKDLPEIPEEIRKALKIVPVETIGQVLEHALRRKPKTLPTGSTPARTPRIAGRSLRAPGAPGVTVRPS